TDDSTSSSATTAATATTAASSAPASTTTPSDCSSTPNAGTRYRPDAPPHVGAWPPRNIGCYGSVPRPAPRSYNVATAPAASTSAAAATTTADAESRSTTPTHPPTVPAFSAPRPPPAHNPYIPPLIAPLPAGLAPPHAPPPSPAAPAAQYQPLVLQPLSSTYHAAGPGPPPGPPPGQPAQPPARPQPLAYPFLPPVPGMPWPAARPASSRPPPPPPPPTTAQPVLSNLQLFPYPAPNLYPNPILPSYTKLPTYGAQQYNSFLASTAFPFASQETQWEDVEAPEIIDDDSEEIFSV
ncbi:hypothetical protein FOCC_FOCC000873, partial [Frankliniella occidentalis]